MASTPKLLPVATFWDPAVSQKDHRMIAGRLSWKRQVNNLNIVLETQGQDPGIFGHLKRIGLQCQISQSDSPDFMGDQ